eukprot:TRINITY_DN12662_c0_g1_i1.p2 TRINITY_DN12662_c0_g1~~TRINITY_DN12662_c0_g1_i1.p2  ORF type:complete len:117 (-),score=12.49 TRINITY_DN12662_c0_g1_i1:97-447(-)
MIERHAMLEAKCFLAVFAFIPDKLCVFASGETARISRCNRCRCFRCGNGTTRVDVSIHSDVWIFTVSHWNTSIADGTRGDLYRSCGCGGAVMGIVSAMILTELSPAGIALIRQKIE